MHLPPGSAVFPEMTSRRRYLVLAICCMSLFIVGMDATIVNVALPSIGRDFHSSVSGLQWTLDAYTLVLASLLMLSGSTADRLGRKRTFVIGLVIFSAGSLLCSLAPTLGCLVAFRMIQAIGGSMLNPVAMSIIRNVFTDARERAQAIGVWGATGGISLALRFVPESRAPHPRRLDPVGQLLVIALFGSLTYAIIEGPKAGWLSTQSVALFAVALAA